MLDEQSSSKSSIRSGQKLGTIWRPLSSLCSSLNWICKLSLIINERKKLEGEKCLWPLPWWRWRRPMMRMRKMGNIEWCLMMMSTDRRVKWGLNGIWWPLLKLSRHYMKMSRKNFIQWRWWQLFSFAKAPLTCFKWLDYVWESRSGHLMAFPA